MEIRHSGIGANDADSMRRFWRLIRIRRNIYDMRRNSSSLYTSEEWRAVDESESLQQGWLLQALCRLGLGEDKTKLKVYKTWGTGGSRSFMHVPLLCSFSLALFSFFGVERLGLRSATEAPPFCAELAFLRPNAMETPSGVRDARAKPPHADFRACQML
jgi:hypothetical protein